MVDGKTLDHIVSFMKYYYNRSFETIKKPLPKCKHFEEIAGSWNDEFIDLDMRMLLSIINASDYMNIPSLLSLACAKVAFVLKNQPDDHIKELFSFT